MCLVARNLDVTPQGALISAREIVGNLNGDIQNSGTIAGQNLTALSAKNIQNHGIVLGKTIWIFVEIIVEKKYTITTSSY
ncbi:hypothetical protein [Actinobacillus porcinus]|uniref:hypothetical protein n=1 Tax=Actinobacillus porcinus TaxID=51048 RepID=UPI0010835C96|nr:hypothetical protein [Actinobacillus porcinus]